MTHIGVYRTEDDFYWFLYEEFAATSNYDLLTSLVLDPLSDMQNDLNNGHNPYIIRERFRLWGERVEKATGICLPEWGNFEEDQDGTIFWDIFETIRDFFYCGECGPEWVIFGDDPHIHVLLEAALKNMGLNSNADDIIRSILEGPLSVEPTDLYVWVACATGAPVGLLYVVKSEETDRCPELDPDSHPFYPIADAENAGAADGSTTYVLPASTIKRLEEWTEAAWM